MKMGNRKLKHGFTLIEMLASMAVFLILITVMMRFFVSAQTVWIKSSRRNELYSNARVALDLISRDLQCALYNNDDSARGIYPFWFRRVKDSSQTGDEYKYPTELNFIGATDICHKDAKSNICEVRYSFITNDLYSDAKCPVDGDGKKIEPGWLVRSCVGDNESSYDFMDYPNISSATNGRMVAIWPDGATYAQVIQGVIKLDFVCYDENNVSFDPLPDSELSTGDKGRYGTYFPVVVTIRLKLMDQENWRKYLKLKNTGSSSTDEEAEELMNKVVRTFSRTVYLGKRESI